MRAKECPPGYNGGFCADYDVDCEACWEQYWEEEIQNDEPFMARKIVKTCVWPFKACADCKIRNCMVRDIIARTDDEKPLVK